MKITNYPKVSKLHCSKCGAEFELNKLDLKKHALYSDGVLDEALVVKCPICCDEQYLSTFESNLRSLVYGKICHIFEEKSVELRENKLKYTKETAVLLNALSEEVLDAIENTEIELGEEIVVEEE